jgi:starch synthase (maltosyl-transferring)
MKSSETPQGLHRVVIEGVSPRVGDGRYPAKRVVGDTLCVSADVYTDGHDHVDARIRYLRPGDAAWRTAPLRYAYDPDRWSGEIPLDRIGRWRYAVEAWPDRWGTWTADLRKRLGAGQDVASELLEGAALLRRIATRARGARASRLQEVAEQLAEASSALEPRIDLALADTTASLAAGPVEPAELTRSEPTLSLVVDRTRAACGAWYELFPRSLAAEPGRHGTFAEAAAHLPRLVELGFDVVYLPPIHPIGHTHRKGRNNTPGAGPADPGSPWAIGSEEGGHTAVHPALGDLADFDRFVGAAKSLGLEVALDYALQCSPDHPWVREHPDWFRVRPDGTIRYAENPPKKYEDIVPLDFWCADREALWKACRDVVLFWIRHGVRIFRVDNPHTKPFAFWEWLIEDVQREHPEVILLAEAFTRPKRMKGLAKIGFTQSYTYFTWKNSAWELREYLEELTQTEMVEYYRPNFFANTPDILHEYLQRGGRSAFRVRLLLAGTLSPIYGIYSGFELCENVPVRPGSEEYLDSEKYQIRRRDWEAPGHIADDIRRLNAIRRENSALQRLANLSFLTSENGQILWYRKSAPGNELLIAVNLDPQGVQEAMVHVPLAELGLGNAPYEVEDLLTGERYAWSGVRNYVRLDPAERPGHLFRVIGPGGAA